MSAADRWAAGRRRALLAGHHEDAGRELEAGAFRAALLAVPPADRDAWIDRALDTPPAPDDGPELPIGCVPYLPCPADAVLAAVDAAEISSADVVVDIGSGLGRAAALVNLLTGARVLGLEVQPALVEAATTWCERLRLTRVSFELVDATRLPASACAGTAFFAYCPFSGARFAALLADLERLAEQRPLRLACVDVPLSPAAWLEELPPRPGSWAGLMVYRSLARG